MSNKGVEDFYSDKLLKEFTLVSSKHAAKSVHIHYMYNGIIPESAVDNLQVSQTASASGVPPLSLSAPVIYKTSTDEEQGSSLDSTQLNS